MNGVPLVGGALGSNHHRSSMRKHGGVAITGVTNIVVGAQHGMSTRSPAPLFRYTPRMTSSVTGEPHEFAGIPRKDESRKIPYREGATASLDGVITAPSDAGPCGETFCRMAQA